MRSARTGHRWAATIVGAILMSLASAITSSAQMFATLHNFDNEDGSEIEGPLLEATDGDLYGTTYANGAYFGGTVYRITPDGAFTTIYNFCRQANCADGSDPVGGLVQGTDGSFYGTTAGGGLYDAGTVFKITRSGTLTTLYTFDIGDGAGPAGLVQGVDGDFYGATFGGGNFSSGTLFKITPTGTLTTIYNFGSQDTDGSDPNGPLVQGADGYFYGTTFLGGSLGGGTVFSVTPGGNLTTFYSFCILCANGYEPYAPLIAATDGNFYGTTNASGMDQSGTVFRLTPSGTLTTVYNFCLQGGCQAVIRPGWLVQGADGNLYGIASAGGAGRDTAGMLFKLTTAGTFTDLLRFDGKDGASPGFLVQDTNGSFYGTTFQGGTYDRGTVFRFSQGLAPFVEAQPTSGPVGTSVNILGSNLTGATSVSFNGTAATFTVSKSGTSIKTTVPVGATTGPVQVVTPSGTLTSNVNFQVLP
ncbi:MAG TPA: choice-of-anchor tandem repeat GloVer-containing protein [Terriglobia bacterium]|nr:choice-of-anchor tandem repeat GloVer-containing protein [Terriglobia bacterium]